ncbi:MAG TPA: glycogen branching protein [Pseudomonas sp.]|nr:glycogen branching protein [Pseudomonas sp.]
MPKIAVTQPFNYAHGPVVKHYKKGEQDVPQAVAHHAATHGFIDAPKAKADAAPAPVEPKQ